MTQAERIHGRLWVYRAVLSVAVVVAVVRLFQLLVAARYGVDFTDEGYYLVWIKDPFAYPFSVTQFGFFYHPIYALLGGDVVRLRQCNILVTFALAWSLAAVFFRSVLAEHGMPADWRSVPMLAIAAVLATTFPSLLSQWLPTPSYNSLALQALLVSGIGLLLAGRQFSGSSILGWAMLGLGGWLAFMAKPSTAAAVAAVALFYILVARKWNPWLLTGSVLVSLLLVCAGAWAIDGSVSVFVQRLAGGLNLIRAIGVEQPLDRLFRIDSFRINSVEALALAVIGVLVVVATVNSTTSMPSLLRMRGIVLIALAVTNLAIASNVLVPDFGKGRYHGLAVWAIPFAAVVSSFIMQRRHWAGGFARGHLALAACFAVFPHAFAFGTGNNYWLTGATAGIYWVLAGVSVFVAAVGQSFSWNAVLPIALGTQLVGLISFHAATDHPYRQPQALAYDVREVQFGDRGSPLLLNADYADYVVKVRALASGAGFLANTPLIDLTGHSPGTLYSLGARSIGQPWLLGGYSGSDNFASQALDLVSCEDMAAAWVLVEPKGPRPLSARVLQSAGIDVDHDFEVIGTVVTPPGFGDYNAGSAQKLLKPARQAPQALRACQSARGRSR